MKKLAIVIVVLLLGVAGWAGASYVIGSKVEKEWTGMVEQYGHWGPMTVELENYRRGFLTSRARTVVEMKVPLAGAPGDASNGQSPKVESVRVALEQTVRHGPFPGGSGPALALIETRVVGISPGGDEFVRLLAKFPRLKDPLGVTRIAFDGTAYSKVNIPPLEGSIDDGRIQWRGLTIEAVSSRRKKTMSGSFDMPGLEISGDDGGMTWDGVRGKIDMTEALPLLYVGTSEARVGTLKMDLPNKKGDGRIKLEMKGLEVTSTSSYRDGLVQAGQNIAFAGLTVEGQTYGPGALELEERNLDGEALADFQQQAYAIYADGQPANPDELVGQLLPLYSQLAMKLAEGTPQLNIRRLHFATPMGDVDGKLLFSFDCSQGMDRQNPALLLQGIEAQADLAVHEELARIMLADTVEGQLKQARRSGRIPDYSDEQIAALAKKQAGEQLEAVIAQNFAVRQGERIKTSATFHHGELVVNGQSLPLSRPRAL